MSSRHQRIYRKRGKDQHVICVNCNVRLKLDDGKGGYRKRFPLTNRLQDRKWDPSRKPGISILEGLVETIPDLAAGNISQILSAMCLCHGCFILLRQVVNCKFKVQNLLVELQQKIGDITNEMRLETNKQAETDDKVIKCWVCQEKFTNKATKFAMHRHVQDELTVKEAIETLLPEESATLQGVSKKYLLICKNCFKILNKIIMSQCQAETTRQSFIETTSEDGLISKILEQGDDFDILDDDDGNDYEDDNKHTEVVVPSASETVSSADMLVVKTELNTEVQASENYEGETEAQSVILVLTGSSVQSGEKRKLQQTCSLIEEDTSEAALTEMYDGLEYQEEKNSKRRKPDVDVLSILQSTNSENEEAQADLGDDLLDAELDEGTLIVDEEDTAEQLSENCLKKVVYYLQQNLFRQAFNILKKNSTIFEEEFQKMVINYIKKETSESDNLENTDWTKLSSLHSGAVTLESYVEAFQENLPMLSAVLSYSIAGQRHVDFTRIEKATLQRLLTVMGVIAFERNPNCHLLQSLNSIQMAEDGCTRELYNTFYGLGLCLKEKDTQKLLTTPDYSTHQVCWHLLKEAQEVRGSKAAKKDNAKAVLKEEDRDLDTDEDYDSLPDDFADVCPYWKLPKTTLSDNDTSSDEWVLHYDPKAAGRAEPIRLIFEEAGVPYQECEEPYDRKEINGGKIMEYPTFSLPVVRKRSLTLTQLPVICRHLGELFGLSPDSADDKLQAEQICHTCHDYLVEARIILEEVDGMEKSQTDKEAKEPVEAEATRLYEKETTKLHIDRFTKNRIPRFLSFFETALKANNSDRGFFFGDKLTYPDLAVLHILRATENYFPEVYKRTTDIPQLKTFRDSISSRPRLKAYFESDRSKVTAGNSV